MMAACSPSYVLVANWKVCNCEKKKGESERGKERERERERRGCGEGRRKRDAECCVREVKWGAAADCVRACI